MTGNSMCDSKIYFTFYYALFERLLLILTGGVIFLVVLIIVFSLIVWTLHNCLFYIVFSRFKAICLPKMRIPVYLIPLFVCTGS